MLKGSYKLGKLVVRQECERVRVSENGEKNCG